MNIWQAVLLGIIQGITEWFPVSSSGHLAITKEVLHLEPSLFFDVILHLGSAVLVIFIFREEVKKVLFAFFRSVREGPRDGRQAFLKNDQRKLALLIIVGSIPTGIIGLTVSLFYEGLLSTPLSIGIALFITGFVLLSTRGKKGKREVEDMNFKDAVVIGLMQGAAAVPGISRSGFTISSSLLRGLKREVAVRYSFLLFLPAIIAAGLLKAFSLSSVQVEWMPLLIGTTVAFLVGYVTIKGLLRSISKGGFHLFFAYCFIVGLAVISLL